MQCPGTQGVSIANGFVVTANAFKQFLSFNYLEPTIRKHLDTIDGSDINSIVNVSARIRRLILDAEFPPELRFQVIDAYVKLSEQYGMDYTDVSLYPSMIDEESLGILFGSQQKAYTSVKGATMLIKTIQYCFAALFTEQAILHRATLGLRQFSVGLSVCVQKMVKPGLAAAGLIYAPDTAAKFTDTVVIKGAYGPAALLVQGGIMPDKFTVRRSVSRKPGIPIIEKKMGDKKMMIFYGSGPFEEMMVLPTEKKMQDRFCLTDEQILTLAEWMSAIKNYTRRQGYGTPMNMEWAVDGRTNRLFIIGINGRVLDFRKKTVFSKSAGI